VHSPWRIDFLLLCLIFLAVFIRGRQTTIVSNCLAQGLIDGNQRSYYGYFALKINVLWG
jgi:hypothetical protein